MVQSNIPFKMINFCYVCLAGWLVLMTYITEQHDKQIVFLFLLIITDKW